MLSAGVVIFQSNKNDTLGNTVITKPLLKSKIQLEENNPKQSIVIDKSLMVTTKKQPSAKPAIVSAERENAAKTVPEAIVSLELTVTEIFIDGIVTDTIANPIAYATIV